MTNNQEWLTIAESRAESVMSAGYGLYTTTMGRATMALVAIGKGDKIAADALYSELALVPGIMVFYVNTDRILGLLAVTLGRLDQAGSHFEDALEFNRKAGYRPDLAWTCHDYADALLKRGGPGDHERATSLLDESLALSQELDMRPLMERVLSRREILKA
jgi:tetratricopeptide (TPR) repeat protein